MAIYIGTTFTAATAAVANQFVVSANMKVGAYTVANSGAMPTAGARQITVTHTAVTGNDTLGTIVVVGKNLAGGTISETITPTAGGTATGSKWFAKVDSVTGAGWVISGGNDTLTVGCTATPITCEGSGVLHGITINATTVNTVVFADSVGTILTVPTSAAVGTIVYDVAFKDYLKVTNTGASNVTVQSSGQAEAVPGSAYQRAAATRTVTDPPVVGYVDVFHMPRDATYPDIFPKLTT